MPHGVIDRIEQAQSTNRCLIETQAGNKTQNGFFVPQPQWQSMCVTLKLSEREAQISRLILCGYSEQAITEELLISAHTVHCYLERLYRKLQVRSRSKLVIALFETYIGLTRLTED